ncbi:MAG TPA: DNA primase [Pirellulales bacterium]|nr:DNA primase [Pirellulales bacterium]
MSSGPLDAKEQIKRMVDIVDLIGESLPLRREGRAYKGLCPWHDDSRPSLHVNPERQTFRCFVCNIGGDIFTFVEKREGVTFREALAILAERAGVTLAPARGSGAGSSAEADQRRRLLQVAVWAEQQFHECLIHAPEAELARRYLQDRGITAESVARFHLGFAPNQFDWLIKRARVASIPPAVLEKVGLVRTKAEGGGHYDFFRGRVLFSIRDLQGRPVAVGGRVLPGADRNTPKYINTPETALFSKSRMLYALDRAKDAITRSRTAMVMEGYTDVVIAHQCGLENAVAVLGTALGEQHIGILRRFADRVLLVLDGDEAGRRRADEILELFVSAQMDLRILTLPDDLDPADFLLTRGKEPFEELLATAVDALEHKLRIATAGLDAQSGVDEAHRAQEEMLRTLAKAPRPADTAAHLREAHILSRLSHRFHVSEVVLRDRLRALRDKGSKPRPAPAASSAAAPSPSSQPRAKPGKIDKAEQELLELVLQTPQLVEQIAQRFPPAAWSDAARRQVFTVCCRLAAQGIESTVDRLLLEIDDGQLKTLIIELDELQRRRPKPDPHREATSLLAVICEPSAVAPRILRPALSDATTSAEDVDRIVKKAQLRHGISAPTDG